MVAVLHRTDLSFLPLIAMITVQVSSCYKNCVIRMTYREKRKAQHENASKSISFIYQRLQKFVILTQGSRWVSADQSSCLKGILISG